MNRDLPMSLEETALFPVSATAIPVSVAFGDGIGPEIMRATLRVLRAAGADIAPEVIDIGEKLYLQGNTAGIGEAAWESLRRTQVFLKAPITTPSGGGYKSLNVTVRKTLGLYANVRPCVSYAPFVKTLHPKMDVVIVRENEEDLYAGIEHRQTDEVTQCLKLITRPGCEKIVRYAFDYARANGRKKITCMAKDNIMKMTDGLFYKVFQEIGAQYPDILQDRMIIDIGAAKLATEPTRFDVIVTPNLYGDIISDIAAEVAASVGLAGSANIGEHVAMFEAIHGSAPDIAGRGIANPSGLLMGAVMMLVHIGQAGAAQRIHNAWLCALEEGMHTADLAPAGASSLSTDAFADAVIARLGQSPKALPAIRYDPSAAAKLKSPGAVITQPKRTRAPAVKRMVGVDVFVQDASRTPDELGAHMSLHNSAALKLKLMTNRGVKVWPQGMPETFCTDHWRCRFMATENHDIINAHDIIALLSALASSHVDVIKTENLCTFDGEPGFSLGQGQ